MAKEITIVVTLWEDMNPIIAVSKLWNTEIVEDIRIVSTKKEVK